MKILLPDALSSPNQLSGSVFLYFFDDSIASTLHPSVSMLLTGMNPFAFYDAFKEKQPVWFPVYDKVFRLWLSHTQKANSMLKVLEPLKRSNYKTILLSYPKNDEALVKSSDLIKKSGKNIDEIFKLIDIESAANELMSHIFFEKYLEIYNIDANSIVKNVDTIFDENRKYDYMPLFNYCDILFSTHSFEQLLCQSYLFRFSSFNILNDCLLTNGKMYEFIQSFNDNSLLDSDIIPFDCIAWEIFKAILSNYTDNITNDNIKKIQKTISCSKDEIKRLKFKCNEIAIEIGNERNYEKLHSKIRIYIKAKVEREIYDLLKIKRNVFDEYITSIFSDEKMWISLGAIITSMILKTPPIISASSVIAGGALLGPKTIKAINNYKNKLKNNDYALIYRMEKL